MYKTTSKSQQGRAERIGIKDMPSIDPALISAPEEYDAAKRRLHQIDGLLLTVTNKDARAKLGQEKHALCARLAELKPLRNRAFETEKGINLAEQIVAVVKESVPRWQWENFVKIAHERRAKFIENMEKAE